MLAPKAKQNAPGAFEVNSLLSFVFSEVSRTEMTEYNGGKRVSNDEFEDAG